MAFVWKFLGTGLVAALIATAFFAGWASSPDSSPPQSTAAELERREASNGGGTALVSVQSPWDEMTRLCTEMMPAGLRPAMQQMMQMPAMRQMPDSSGMQQMWESPATGQMMQDMMKRTMPGMMGR